jgi:hypothetical protein
MTIAGTQLTDVFETVGGKLTEANIAATAND